MRHDRTYTELSKLKTFDERFKYLLLHGKIGIESFGYDRYLNQIFYKSPQWKKLRDQIILRDNGSDLGLSDYPILGRVMIHHLNPITVDDVLDGNPDVFNPEYLICTSHKTHNAIHYGMEDYIREYNLTVRKPNDTIPWR